MPDPSVIGTLRFATERRQLIALLWMTIIPPALLTLEDAFDGGVFPSLLIRAFPALVAACALASMRYVQADSRFRSRSFWVVLGLVAALVVSNAARPESELIPLRGRMLGPALIYLLAPNTIAKQAGPAIAMSVGLTLLRAYHMEPLQAWPFANDVLFVVVINVAGLLLVRSRLDLEQSVDHAWTNEREARLAAEQARVDVRTLESIIPICAHCRRLRADGGEWQRLERYVRDATGTQFSHGLCPECMQTHYSEFVNPG